MAMALGVLRLDDIGDRIAGLPQTRASVGFGGLREAFGKLGELRSAPPKTVAQGSCQEVVLKGDEVDLNLLPGIQAWPDDGGIFLNLGSRTPSIRKPALATSDVPAPAARRPHRRPALADPQGFQSASRRRRAAW